MSGYTATVVLRLSPEGSTIWDSPVFASDFVFATPPHAGEEFVMGGGISPVTIKRVCHVPHERGVRTIVDLEQIAVEKNPPPNSVRDESKVLRFLKSQNFELVGNGLRGHAVALGIGTLEELP